MKKVIIFLSLQIIWGFNLYSQSVGISDAAAQSIDASAVLDVQSATRGVLLPRMDSTARKAISSPVEGLLVFDTSTKSFWFYGKKDDRSTVSWREVLNGSISDRNRITVKEGGTLILSNAATTWNDLVVSPFSTYTGGSNPPAFTTFKTTVQTFRFDDINNANEQQVFFSIQIPHNWKEGTVLYPHVHWSPQTTGSNTTSSAVWGFEYSWANYDPVTPVLFPNTTTITATTSQINFGTDQDKHFITDLPSITDGTKKISSILMCRFFRKSNDAADTYTGGVALLSFDIHYEIDGFGSDQPFIK